MKKITGFILASVLLLTVMCGCSPEKEKTAAQSDTAISTMTTTAVTTETTEESTTASTTVQTTHVPSTTQSTVHSTSRSAASTQRKRQQEHKTTVSTTKKQTTTATALAEAHCTNNNNHSASCGNIGNWYNNKSDIEEYWNTVRNNLINQYNKGDITWEEYISKVPSGYECWSCSYCGKWTGNFKYR